VAVLGLYVLAAPVAPTARRTDPIPSLLESHLLVTYYGNPHSALMGVLGKLTGQADPIGRHLSVASSRQIPRALRSFPA